MRFILLGIVAVLLLLLVILTPSRQKSVSVVPLSITETHLPSTQTGSPPALLASPAPALEAGDKVTNLISAISGRSAGCATYLNRSSASSVATASVVVGSDGPMFFCSGSGIGYCVDGTSEHRRPIHVASCPIDLNHPVSRPVAAFDARSGRRAKKMCYVNGTVHSRVCSKIVDTVFISSIYRPQHAFQFLFSLASIFSLLASLPQKIAAPPESMPILLSVMSYGSVNSLKAFCAKTHRHLDFLELLHSDETPLYLYRDSAWSHSIPAPTFEYQHTHRPIASWCREDMPRKAASFVCARSVVAGSIPVRLPHLKKFKVAPESVESIEAGWLELRRRVLARWLNMGGDNATAAGDTIKSNSSTWSGSNYFLVVQRGKGKGRGILGAKRLALTVQRALERVDNATGVKAVFVAWENMNLKEQLRLAVSARGIVGAHGNGLVWQCFMPRGAFVVELSSTIPNRNEVRHAHYSARNVSSSAAENHIHKVASMNAGNVASLCGMSTMSLRVSYTDSDLTKNGDMAETRMWKSVDLMPQKWDLQRIEHFILMNAEPVFTKTTLQ